MAAALRKLAYLDDYVTSTHTVEPSITLGYVGRSAQRGYASSQGVNGRALTILTYGAIFRRDPFPHRVSAPEALLDFEAGEFTALRDSYDGGFVLVVFDHRQGFLYVANDRLGIHPVYYRVGGGILAFAPEVKALIALTGGEAKLSQAGLICLLTAGYNLGAQTLFRDVQALEPGTILRWDLNKSAMARERYWSIRYEPAPEFKHRSVAVRALYESVERAHRLLLSDSPRTHDLFLSGGLDSRGILGVLDRLGATPHRAISWGVRDDIPHSDAWVARGLAGHFDVPFRFLDYGTDGFPELAQEWAYVSELANDNWGRYGEGMAALRGFYRSDSDCTFIGDEVWGCLGYADDEVSLRGMVLPPTIPDQLRAVLRPALFEVAAADYHEAVEHVLRPCQNVDRTDRKDFLYLHGRLTRFIFSIGYYREIAAELRRPFLARDVVEVIQRLPVEHRVHKNLYVSMVKRYLPQVMTWPQASVSSLPDWPLDLHAKEPVRTAFRDLLQYRHLEVTPLAELLDRERFERYRDEYFASVILPVDRRASLTQRTKMAVHQTVLERPLLARGLRVFRRGARREEPTRPVDVLWRIALCVLLHRSLGRFNSS